MESKNVILIYVFDLQFMFLIYNYVFDLQFIFSIYIFDLYFHFVILFFNTSDCVCTHNSDAIVMRL